MASFFFFSYTKAFFFLIFSLFGGAIKKPNFQVPILFAMYISLLTYDSVDKFCWCFDVGKLYFNDDNMTQLGTFFFLPSL